MGGYSALNWSPSRKRYDFTCLRLTMAEWHHSVSSNGTILPFHRKAQSVANVIMIVGTVSMIIVLQVCYDKSKFNTTE